MGVRPLKLLKFSTIIFVLIIALGFVLRVYKIDSVPPGLTWDEAALGYNAYSILKTGRDEYGSLLPLTLKSFGDYKPALYAYLDIPFIAAFGLNEFAVRFPSVLAGVGFIIVCYLLVKQIFKNEWLGLCVAFFASISPLSIQFSRAGFESNVAVFLNVLGVYMFLKALHSSKYFFGSAAAFIFSMLCYQASKMFVPIIIIGLFLFFKKRIKVSRNLFLSLIIVVIAGISIYLSTFIFGQSGRLASQNLFAYRRSDDQINLVSKEDGFGQGTFPFMLLHGEWFKFASGILERYLIYFSPDTLFIEGDYSPRHNVPDLGILNYYALIFIPFGFYLLLRKKEHEKNILFFWLFTATIPAVLSRDLISTVRALNLMFPFVILEGFGFYFLVKKIANVAALKIPLVLSAFLLFILINFFLYLDFLFIHTPIENASGWLYGYKQVLEKAPDFSKYDKVIFSDIYGQPYIYYLFYTEYPPEKFQKQAILEQKTVDVGTVRRIDNIEFRPVYWPQDRGLENSLFVGDGFELPDQDILTEQKSKKISIIYFPDGETAFKIVENGYE